MTIRAGGRVALIAATGLLAFVVGVSWTLAASSAAESKSEQVSTSKKVKQVRYYKRYAHRKYTRTAQKSSEDKKPGIEVADAGVASELPASVANANARMGGDVVVISAAPAMTARANALLSSDPPTDQQGSVTTLQVVEADQLNDADKTLQEQTPPSQTTVAVAPAKPVTTAVSKAMASETSTWDQTSLIGKIFIAFGALLTVASAARMFMA
ncbi:hypothetical protein ES707_03871 [subsurface metagenome]|jgi:hypothetical protein